jgi:hypothetical protein
VLGDEVLVIPPLSFFWSSFLLSDGFEEMLNCLCLTIMSLNHTVN